MRFGKPEDLLIIAFVVMGVVGGVVRVCAETDLVEINFSESPEMFSCLHSPKVNGIPLQLSHTVGDKEGFITTDITRKPYLDSIVLLAEISDSYVMKVDLGSLFMEGLGVYREFSKKFGFRELPSENREEGFWIGIPLDELKAIYDSGDYCLIIALFDGNTTYGYSFNSVMDDTRRNTSFLSNVVLSYQTASIGGYVVDGFPMIFGPFYISAIDFWYYGAEYYLRPKGLNVSADFLQHSLLTEPEDLEFDGDSEVAKKIRGSEEYEIVVWLMKKGIDEGKLVSEELDPPISLEFASGDLLTSIKKSEIVYEAVPTDKGYNVNITITDDYDYHPLLKEYGSNLFLTAANNLAFVNQYLGVIHKYGIRIEFQEFIPFNELDNE